MKIDTHLHVLLPDRFSYPWKESFDPLRGLFSLEDYRAATDGTGIAGALFMEVDVAPEDMAGEAAYFCGLSEDPANGLLGVIEAFGWDRCAWGGDWPVCTLNGTLSSRCAALDRILAEETPEHRQALYADNAKRIYGL